MTSISYLLSITALNQDPKLLLAILNTAGRGQAFHGTSNGESNKTLWIIPKGRNTKQEVAARLQAIPGIENVSVITLSIPATSAQLTEVRASFTDYGWDTTGVTNDELSLFINSKVEGKYSYYIEQDRRKDNRERLKIRIKPIEQHPQFSPDWFKTNDGKEEDDSDRDLTIDDIEVREVRFESGKDEPTLSRTKQ